MWRTNTAYNLGTFTADGNTTMKPSQPFRNQGFTLITTGFSWTIKFYASNAKITGTKPDLSVAASATNEYSVVQTINLQDWNPVDGATWISFTTDTSVSRYEVNDNNNNFVWVGITNVTAGSVTVRLDMTDNQ